MIEPMTKECTRCLQVKSASEFYARAGSRDGLRNYCKDCQNNGRRSLDEPRRCRKCSSIFIGRHCYSCSNVRRAIWLAKNPGKASMYSKAYAERNPEKVREMQAAYKAKNAEKTNARTRAANERYRTDLVDSYVARSMGFKVGECPIELIDLKRVQIKIQRLVKEKK